MKINFLKFKASPHHSGEDKKARGGPPPFTPPAGCENYANVTAAANATTCCPSLPKAIYNSSAFANCKNLQKGGPRSGGWCARVDCQVNALNLTDNATGLIDTTKAIALLTPLLNGSNYVSIQN